MSNTTGTILRVIGLFIMLVGGWFLAVMGLYALMFLIAGTSFDWVQIELLFGAVILVRMFYPRNVFKW